MKEKPTKYGLDILKCDLKNYRFDDYLMLRAVTNMAEAQSKHNYIYYSYSW